MCKRGKPERMPQAASTSVCKCQMRHAEMREMLILTCSRGAEQHLFVRRMFGEQRNAICLESVLHRKTHSQCWGARLSRQLPNKPLFDICSGLPQSRMPRSHSHTDMDIPSYCYAQHCKRIFLWSTDSKWIAFNCSSNVRHINECCSYGHTSIRAKSGLFGVRLVKCIPSIANIFFFEIPTPNG